MKLVQHEVARMEEEQVPYASLTTNVPLTFDYFAARIDLSSGLRR